jgi:putative acyl-CoA dehydrogenase
MRVARAVEAPPRDPAEAAFARIATAVGKYWICKRAPLVAAEALECIGGNGYVEESLLPRLYRQAPLNSIWEGSGNIQCLDVLRALAKEPATGAAVWRELQDAPLAPELLERLRAPLLGEGAIAEAAARRYVESLALALQASVLHRAGSPFADAFVGSRLAVQHGGAFGTLSPELVADGLLERTLSL